MFMIFVVLSVSLPLHKNELVLELSKSLSTAFAYFLILYAFKPCRVLDPEIVLFFQYMLGFMSKDAERQYANEIENRNDTIALYRHVDNL